MYAPKRLCTHKLHNDKYLERFGHWKNSVVSNKVGALVLMVRRSKQTGLSDVAFKAAEKLWQLLESRATVYQYQATKRYQHCFCLPSRQVLQTCVLADTFPTLIVARSRREDSRRIPEKQLCADTTERQRLNDAAISTALRSPFDSTLIEQTLCAQTASF